MSKSLLDELKWRGFAYQTTLTDAAELDKKKFTFYLGVDPSSDSMTVGNLATAMMARHFISYGHKAVLLVGGATGLIGDPDGKSKERELLSKEEVERNKEAIVRQYKTIFSGANFDIVDNEEWFKDIKYIDFLRNIGKHVPLRQMVNREFVQSRLGEGGSGISYAEFSYSLIQAYDFLYLFKKKGVNLQICGSDQWGNSIAGVELIRRIEGKEANVWSAPLVVNKLTGEKFGKTEEGAVWLAADKTSPFDFYQFWLNVDDQSVDDYLKIYTLLSHEDINKTMEEFKADPGKRKAQKTLAYETTKLLHGKSEVDSIERINACLFGQADYAELTAKDIATMKDVLPVCTLKQDTGLIQVLVASGLAGSNGEARRAIQQNSVSVNSETVGEDYELKKSDGVANGHAIVKKGKNKYAIIDIG